MIACLYTKHKTQKKKTYHDGHVTRSATKLTLQNDAGATIDSMPQTAAEWSRDFPHFDFPKYLVDIDEDAYSGSHALPAAGNAGAPRVEAAETPRTSFGRPGGTAKPPPGKYVPPRNKFQAPKRKHEDERDGVSENKNAADFTRTFTLNKPTSTPHHTPSPPMPQLTVPEVSSKRSRHEVNVDEAPRREVVEQISMRDAIAPVADSSELSNYVGCEWPELPKPPSRTYDEVRRLLGC